jgi:glycosyltransferase involved in cell wall biosynthesis
MLKKILITGAFQMPDRDAGATRVLGVSQLFSKFQFEVEFAGWEEFENGVTPYYYRELKCFPQAEYKMAVGLISKIYRLMFLGLNTFRWIRANPNYDVIILYNPPAFFAALMLIWCRLNKKAIILDSTEWYELEHIMEWSGGKYSIKSYLAIFENFIRMRFIYPKFHNIIAISFFLESYYKKSNVIRIPPIFFNSRINDLLGDELVDREIGSELRFIYAGSAGKKDNLVEFITALPEISNITSKKVNLLIMGLSASEVHHLLSEAGFPIETFKPYFCAVGRVSRDEALLAYKNAHFSVLIRDNKRYAKAGFPTKLMESWILGCPVIANAVGDVSVIGESGVDTVFINRRKFAEDVGRKIKVIIDSNCYLSMKKSCKKKASYYFSVEAYCNDFGRFIDILNLPKFK